METKVFCTSFYDIAEATFEGIQVYWENDSYKVFHDTLGQWLVVHDNGTCVGITERDTPAKFYYYSKAC